MSNKHELKWSDVAGHPVVICPVCKGKSECGSENYESLELYGLCATCRKKEDKSSQAIKAKREKGLSDLKQLDQSVFEGAPDGIRSAHVREDGSAWLATLPTDYVNTMLKDMGGLFGMPTIFVGEGYDTTNWQNSAINRGE